MWWLGAGIDGIKRFGGGGVYWVQKNVAAEANTKWQFVVRGDGYVQKSRYRERHTEDS